MSQSESFDAFYARTSWNVTSQMHALAGEDPLADHAIREAYAKAYQQWYEVSTYPDPEAWVLGVAKDAYQRRLAEAAIPGEPAPATGHDPLSWPGMFRPARPQAQPVFDPDATLDPRLTAPADQDTGGSAPVDGQPLAGTAAGGSPTAAPTEVPPGSLFGSRPPGSLLAGEGAGAGALAAGASRGGAAWDGAPSDWFTPAQGGAAGGAGVGSMPTATIGDPPDSATMPGRPGIPRPGRPGGDIVPRLRGSRRNLIIAATAVVVLLAGGIYFALGGAISGHGATPPASRGPGGKSAVHMLAAGQTGSRTAIPWSLIGPGWTLAEVSTAQATSSGPPAGGAHVMYLVDPEGGKYRIQSTASAAAPTLLAWSGDAKEALYAVSGVSGGPAASYGLLTLASGTMTPLPLPVGVTPLGFTRPDGFNIVAIQQTPLKYRLQRYNLEGAIQATIGTMPRPTGAASFPRFNALSSLDGNTAVWGVDGDGMQLVSNAGGHARKLRMPGTGSPKSCTPVSWWNADTVLAYCNAAGQQDAGRLWLASVGGGSPSALTGISGSLSGIGRLTGAWQAGSAVYATATTGSGCPGAASGPNGQQILLVGTGGAESAVSIPTTQNHYASVVAGVGARLLVLAETSCPGTSSLIWFNPSTHVAQALLSAPSTEAGVVGAVPFGSGPAATAG